MSAGTSLGEPKKQTTIGTSLGGTTPRTTLGTNLGGTTPRTTLGGTSLGGTTPRTTLGGTNLGAATPRTNVGTSLGGATPRTNLGTSLGGSEPKPDAPKKKKKPKKKEQNEDQNQTKTETSVPQEKPVASDSPAPAPETKKEEIINEVKKTAPPAKKGANTAQKGKGADTAKKGAKKTGPNTAFVAHIKALQAEQERIKKEEEEKKRLAEEAEKLRIERELQEEEERKKALEIKKEKQKLLAKKKVAEDTERKRLEKIAKYGYTSSEVAQKLEGKSRAPTRGRGRGGRRGGGPGRGQNIPVQEKEEKEEIITEKTENNNGNSLETENVEKEEADVEDWEDVVERDIKLENESEKMERIQKEEQEKLQKAEEEAKEKKAEEKRKREEEITKKKEEEAAKKQEALAKGTSKLRSPIICVLGHVDTGKTSLLDKIRASNVQAGEAGGITQQIGATFFPMATIRLQTKKLLDNLKKTLSLKVPGLLIIDTPGHASFTNLRTRGSSLCDIAVLVIDLMHGIEPQTRESISLLRKRKTPFVVALNKVDRCFGWKSTPFGPIQESLSKQERPVIMEFEDRVKRTIADLAGEKLNGELYYKVSDFKNTVAMVPTSAVSGEGIPDLLLLLVQISQNLMADKILELSELQCTILEVKKVEGRGTTLDVILANGVLNQNDKIICCGVNHQPIITHIRALLTPPPACELRVKSDYIQHKTLRASIGCKIDAPDLDNAVAGSPLFVIKPNDNVEYYKAQVQKSLSYLEGKINKGGTGVYVQASTLGSMEALLEYLKEDCKVPVSGIHIGPVHKKDVMFAMAMLERAKEYACILAFDVKVTPEAKEYANANGVKIFEADIIYHLFDKFTLYIKEVRKKVTDDAEKFVIFPCYLKPLEIFKNKNPIVMGVHVEEGIVRIGTPIVVKPPGSEEWLELGEIISVQKDHKDQETAGAGEDVAIAITPKDDKQKRYMAGRHFTEKDDLYSFITRASIDAMKQNHRDIVEQKPIIKLIVKLKKLFNI